MVTLEYRISRVEFLLGEEQTLDIWSQSFGEEKICYLAQKISLLEALVSDGFNGSHFAQIVVGAGWKEKLDWVVENYEHVMKLKGFNQSQTAKILRNKGWKDKIRWIEDYFDPNKYSTANVTNLMQKKDWEQRLRYSAA